MRCSADAFHSAHDHSSEAEHISHIATDYEPLRALFEQYEIQECWCGYGASDVVKTYVAAPSSPDASAELCETAEHAEHPAMVQMALHYRVNFNALRAVSAFDPATRKADLIAEIEDAQRAHPDEASAREIIVSLGGESLLDFSDFWSPTGDPMPPETLAHDFLEILKKYAQEATA